MKIVNIAIGSPEWVASRSASKAPAMMGCGYMNRNDLLRLMATGIAEEINAGKQALFDSGHAAEAAARKLVEAKLGRELPALTATSDDGYLLASFDGIAGTTGWECKLWREDLAAQVRAKELEPMYYWQLEQQIIVGKLKRVIFTVSDGTPERCLSMEYKPVPGRAEQLLAGWKQFDTDLAAYQPIEVLPPVTAAPTMQLPALSIQVKGSITLIDNLALFGEKLTAFIAGLDKNPSDDQAFADCEAAVKTLQTAQEALEAAEAMALGQVASVDEMRRTVALYAGQARNTRLMLEKLVKARKESIRVEIVQGGRKELAEHITFLNLRIGRAYMPDIPVDFAGVIKGKKTVASLHDAVDTEVARVKIETNRISDQIQINLATLRELAADYASLFPDTPQIVLKAPDDLTALVKTRIRDYQESEAKRLEAEREKIRAEETAKLERKAEQERAKEEKRLMEESMARRLEEERASRTGQPAAAQVSPLADKEKSDRPDSPAPAAAPFQPPRRDQIIAAVALAFDVNAAIAERWIEVEFQRRAA